MPKLSFYLAGGSSLPWFLYPDACQPGSRWACTSEDLCTIQDSLGLPNFVCFRKQKEALMRDFQQRWIFERLPMKERSTKCSMLKYKRPEVTSFC